MVRGLLEIFELAHVAPLGNRTDVNIQQSRGGTGRVSPIPPWLIWRERLGPWQGGISTEPLHFRGGGTATPTPRGTPLISPPGGLLDSGASARSTRAGVG